MNTAPRSSSSISSTTLRRSYQLRLAPHGSWKHVPELRHTRAVGRPKGILMEAQPMENSPDLATSHNDMANLYNSQRKNERALTMYMRSLDLRTKSSHPPWTLQGYLAHKIRGCFLSTTRVVDPPWTLQGYLAHKKQPTPLGPP